MAWKVKPCSDKYGRPWRKCSGVEGFMTHHEYSMGPVVLAAVLAGSSIEQGQLAAAAHAVAGRHPMLRCEIDDELLVYDMEEPFIEAEVWDEDMVPTDTAHPESMPLWQRAVHRQMTTAITRKHSRWRVVWVPDSEASQGQGGTLLIACSHVCCDGTSICQILHDMLTVLAGEALPPPPAQYALGLPPPIKEHFEEIGFVEKGFCWMYQGELATQAKACIDAPPLPAIEPVSCVIAPNIPNIICRFQTSSAEAFQKLNTARKQHGATIGTIWMAAVRYAALKQVLAKQGHLPMSGSNINVGFEFDINLRDRVTPPLPAGDVSNCIGFSELKSQPLDMDFWECAAAFKDTVQPAVDEAKYVFHVVDTYVNDAYDAYWSKYGIKDPNVDCVTFANLSNIGSYKHPTTVGPFNLQDFYVTNGHCGRMLVAWCHGVGDHLCFSQMTASKHFTGEMSDELLNDTIQILEDIGNGEQPGTLHQYFEKHGLAMPTSKQHRRCCQQ